MTTMAFRLKTLMEKKGLRQIDIVKYAGLSRSSVSLWLSGDTKSVRRDKLEKVCEILGCTPQYLLYGEDDQEYVKSEPKEVKYFVDHNVKMAEEEASNKQYLMELFDLLLEDQQNALIDAAIKYAEENVSLFAKMVKKVNPESDSAALRTVEDVRRSLMGK